MSPSSDASPRLVSLFQRQPCWMIDEIAEKLTYSIPSVRRYLTQVGYYSSFTHNGKWYTLASIPRFNQEGLWFHEDIGFSRAGSLTNSLAMLVEQSTKGMTAEQLGEKLRSRCHAVLVKLYRQGRLQRQKLGRSFIYLSADDKIADSQRQAVEKTKMVPLPAEIAVLVLAEFIRNPDAGYGKLANTIGRRTGLQIEANQIKALFDRHSLKKTP